MSFGLLGKQRAKLTVLNSQTTSAIRSGSGRLIGRARSIELIQLVVQPLVNVAYACLTESRPCAR